jgi:hypothetical protein
VSSIDVSPVAANLEARARLVREILWQLEDPMAGVKDDYNLLDALEHYLEGLFVQVVIALEHFQLFRSRSELAASWQLCRRKGLREVDYRPDPGIVESEAYNLLDAFIEGIRCLGPSRDASLDRQAALHELEALLERTAYSLQCRNITPAKETDVQHVMDDYLSFIYGADYHRQFTIPGVVKNFRPDSGVRSLGVAIEFKFVTSKAEFKTAISGLFEDAGGYRASNDWSKYYSVIYMTGAYGTREQAEAAFAGADMVDWTPIVVTGHGARAKRRPRKSK